MSNGLRPFSSALNTRLICSDFGVVKLYSISHDHGCGLKYFDRSPEQSCFQNVHPVEVDSVSNQVASAIAMLCFEDSMCLAN